jgi:FkbM family methyltransferase
MNPMRALQTTLRKRGIEVRKHPSERFPAVSVFGLATQLLMSRNGKALRFVQVGANDGFQFGDPIFNHVIQDGWTGILIEPQPDVFERLRQTYAAVEGLIFENIAIGADGASLDLYKARGATGDIPGVSSGVSADPRVLARQMGVSPDSLEKISVPAMTLDALLRKHVMDRVDVLQIDVEGYDWQALRTLDLGRVRPSVIQFEHGHMSRADCDAAVRHLSANRYRSYWGGYENDSLALDGDVLAD